MNFLIFIMSEAPSSPSIDISNRILMDFYGEVFRLYPNIRSIQESLDEEKKRFSCIFTLSEAISVTQEEEMQSSLLDTMQKRVVPTLPPGYTSITQDVIVKIPKIPEDVVLKKFCQELQEKYPDIVEMRYTFIGDNIRFDIVWSISPRLKQIIRQNIIAEFPLWNEYQPRDPVFYQNENKENMRETSVPTTSRFWTQIRSILERVL